MAQSKMPVTPAIDMHLPMNPYVDASMDTALAPVRSLLPFQQPSLRASMGPDSSAHHNALLGVLGKAELLALLPHLELVNLPTGKRIVECGDQLDYAYFPISGLVALTYDSTDGASTQLAVIGCEGVFGVALYEGEQSNCTAQVQNAGYAFRMANRELREVFKLGGTLPQLLMRHATALFTQIAHNVVSGTHYSVEGMIARWLLERLDRNAGTELRVTHERIGQMLGVRRESVTMVLGMLQTQGIISYSRGRIAALKRADLEAMAGTCYSAVRDGYAQMGMDFASFSEIN